MQKLINDIRNCSNEVKKSFGFGFGTAVVLILGAGMIGVKLMQNKNKEQQLLNETTAKLNDNKSLENSTSNKNDEGVVEPGSTTDQELNPENSACSLINDQSL